MMLKSPAKLKVGFTKDPVPETPCDPPAQGGYLGADNQLIRVQLVGYDSQTDKARLVWGFNNASFLYRVKVDAADPKTIELLSTPIDSYHAPSANRPVEILRSAVDLKDGDYIAAHCGIVPATPQQYVPETRRLVLQNDLPPAYVGGTAPLFLRLWEEEISFTTGQTVPLGNTGLQVTIDLDGTFGALTAGQFWMFAVRPSTPVELYPQRYLAAMQPPEGPRLWACPLATVAWGENKFTLLDDCREKFDNLVELTKRHSECCSTVIKPEDVGGGVHLQELLDKLAGQKATVSLQPGTYELPAPLKLTNDHSKLTLEGCHDGAVLTARPDKEHNFTHGLIQMNLANDVTLRRLRFQMPLARGKSIEGVRPFAASIGVLAVHCADLRIEECLFRFRLTEGIDLHAAGLLATSECWNLRVERSRFLHDDEYERKPGLTRRMIGILASIAFPEQKGDGTKRAVLSSRKVLDGIPMLLENCCIIGNEFAGLTAAVYARADIGRVRCQDNLAHGCDAGFYFLDTDQSDRRALVMQSYRPKFRDAAEEKAFTAAMHSAQLEMQRTTLDLALRVPLPAETIAPYLLKVGKEPDMEARKVATAQAKSSYEQLLAAIRAGDAKLKSATNDKDKGEERLKATEETKSDAKASPPAAPAKIDANGIKAMTTSMLAAAPAEQPMIRHAADLHFSGNDVEILEPQQDVWSARIDKPLALYVAFKPGQDASVMVTANHLRGKLKGSFVATVQHPTTTTITGNIVDNMGPKDGRRSIGVSADSKNRLMSVTGNACRGSMDIDPFKPGEAGCSAKDWNDLNSVMP
jgi:hypothetical protein